MADTKNKSFPLVYKGVNLKLEPGLIPDGEFSTAQNLTSIQEGGISPRRGCQEFIPNTTIGAVHSLAKLTIGASDATNPRYVGDGGTIRRCTGPYTTFTTVASPTSGLRWESATFNAGTSGTPYLFIADPSNMYWDNGTYPQLYPWGIIPAIFPALAVPSNPSLPNNSGFVILTTQSGGSARLSGISVASSVQLSPNYFQVTPNSMVGIVPGMYVFIGAVLSLVDSVTNTTFNTYSTTTPAGSITSFYQLVDLNADGSPASSLTANGSSYYGQWNAAVDWSFSGTSDNGYDSDDLVHIGLWVSDLSDITQINIQVLVNGSANDYYSKAIATPTAQPYVDNSQLATEVQAQIAQDVTSGVLGSVEYPSDYGTQIQPVQMTPQVDPTWMEFDIPKSSFLPVGNAGSGAYSWKQVTGVQVWVTSADVAGGPTFSVEVGAIYGHGNQGPDSVTEPQALPYQYCYTFRNPTTLEEGNPSPYMVSANYINVQLRAVQVTVYGTSTSATGNPALQGFGSIAVYRAGGTFADGLFRFVGFSTNPGVDGNGFPLPALFIDNYSDLTIAGNDEMETDNWPPVSSSLPTAYNNTIGAPDPVGGNPYPNNLFSLGLSPTPASQFFSPGTPVTIGTGANQEIATVFKVGLGFIDVWLQNTHFSGEPIYADFKVGQPCDIVCQAGDSLLLAGDANNPHICYRSKAGAPASWPIINFETGNSHQQIIGSPDNPIMGLLDYGGGYVSINKKSIFTFQLWLGEFLNVTQSPADRGMVGKHLWCRVNNQIWFLSYDGIYAWAGGGCVKVTQDIDPIFVGETFNGFNPLDFGQLSQTYIESFENYVYLSYRDTSGNVEQIRYSLIYKRWEPVLYNDSAAPGALTVMMVEKDTGRMVGGIFLNTIGASALHLLELGTSDHFVVSPPTAGVGIQWSGVTGSMAPEGRALNKQFVELLVELSNPTDSVSIGLYYDYSSTLDPIDQFSIAPAAGRRFVPLPLGITNSAVSGKEARVAAIQFFGTSVGQLAIYSVQFTYVPLAELQRGRITDWTDNGHPWDKRIYSITIDFNSYGNSVVLFLDTISAVNGNVINLAIQSLTLFGSDRAQIEIPMMDGIIAKKLRLRAQVPNANFEIFGFIINAENYPQDIVRFTEYTDNGYPFDKYYQQLVLDVNTGGIPIPVQVVVDGTVRQTVTVTTTLDTRDVTITLNPDIKGKKARLLLGTLPFAGMFQLWSSNFVTQPADKGAVAHSLDWDDLGHPFDKHLSTCTIEYDNKGAGPITVNIDTLTGIGGGTVNAAAFTFVLGATGRGKETFGIPDGQVVKMIRMYPSSDNITFQQWKYKFEFESYPADTVLWTPWDDFGYEHLKIIQEIAFDVNTNGVAASVALQADGGALQTLSVTSTLSTREQIMTLSPVLVGKKFKLLITPGSGGQFQLWKWKPKFLKGDPGPVEHSFDWDNLGTPFDKRLITVSFEYDTAGTQTTMLMDTVTGVNGTTFNPTVQSFILSGTGRCEQSFAIAIDTIVKMVRIYPQSTTATLRVWKYSFTKVDLPPDIVAATEWSDVGWKCEKVWRGVEIDIDTGGVACELQLELDGVVVQTWSVTSNDVDRVRILTCVSNLIGKMARIIPTPGAGGKAQIFKVTYDVWNEPCYRTHLDLYESALNYVGFKVIRQIWVEYVCTAGITLSVYVADDALFYQVPLPPHADRDIERLFLPDQANGQYNKSKVYRITVDAVDGVTPFKIYMESSRVESLPLSGQQRASYAQFAWNMLTQPGV